MKAIPWVLTVVAAVIGLLMYGAERETRGRAEAEGLHWKLQFDALAKVARKVDTLYRVRRDTFFVRRDRLDTLTVTVDRWKHDTVKVVEYVARADSTVRACSLALMTCEERDGVRLQQLAAWQQRWDTREKPPSAFRQWTERIASGLVGYGLGRLAP